MNLKEHHYYKETEKGAIQKIVVILRMCPCFILGFKQINYSED